VTFASLAAVNRVAAEAELDEHGFARIGQLLTVDDCQTIARLYDREELFRSHVTMARHGFGRGEYRYFSYPLPDAVRSLRSAFYSRLVPIANRWNSLMGLGARFPSDHDEFLVRCHGARQSRPTPLLLKYGAGDYNCLHQDVYGENLFPLQVAILLSDPKSDFEGGEFVLTEQRPRMQSKVAVIPLAQGDAVIFAVRDRPVRGANGNYRVKHRHGVSQLRKGNRYVLGIIFHDAE
jgi:hypothetical protein